MSSPRKQFILLGLVCQALAWEGYAVLFLYLAAWWILVRLPEDRLRLSARTEGLMLFLGCAFGVAVGLLPQQTPHFFLGHGLAFLQLARLPRAVNAQERRQSVLVAFLHLGVACTVVLDYRFLPLLVGALLLIPRVLAELEAAGFSDRPASLVRWRPSFGLYAGLFVGMVLAFLVFPRGLIGTPIQLRRGGAEGTLADAMLDPRLGGLQQSANVLLQIEGADVGYLRALALPDFLDGAWRADERPVMTWRFYPNRQPPEDTLPRRVRVKDARFLDKVLPTDGRVAYVRGKFFRDAHLNLHSTVQTLSMWNTGNNLYEYWTHAEIVPQRPPGGLRRRYLDAPPLSPRVRAWLDEQLAGVTAPLEQARRLEAHLRDTFTYTLGAPELARVNALEEFLLEEKQGHCERFASALALLLRAQGVPSRVVVGYVPGQPNRITGWRNVRFRDAHAWTEAWFEDVGWVELDATPRGSMDLPDSYIADLLHAVDVLWYLNIVNYDAPTQSELFSTTGQWLSAQGARLRANATWLLALAVTAALLWWLRANRWRFPSRPRGSGGLNDAQIVAGHFYGEFLRTLAKQGFRRHPARTPEEFLGELAGAKHPALAEAEALTRFFCAHRYGGRPVDGAEQRTMEDALRRLRTTGQGRGHAAS
jgi:transglutaminase-like putative cysteine protease